MNPLTGRTRWTTAILSRFHHPTQIVVVAFALAVALGTILLLQPVATEGPETATFTDALFTATSAVTVTGLATVDTSAHWSTFGEVTIAVLVQIGGLGIMTVATLLAILVGGKMGLRFRLLAQAETSMLSLADVRNIARKVVVFSLVGEAIVAAVLAGRFMIGYGYSFGDAVYYGVFHSIMAFNHAGFALWPDSLMQFVSDPWINLSIAGAVIFSGLGFPVVFEQVRNWRHPSRWSIMTKLTMWMSLILLVLGTLLILLTEWRNPATLGPLDDGQKLLAAFFASVNTRSCGFNAIDIAQMHESSWLVSDLLMFIGGGSASTAGGIKVTTFGILLFVILAELRGESRVNIGNRRIPETVQRQALTVGLLSVALIAVSTYVLLVMTEFTLDKILFEAISAFSTTGLSTGILNQMPPAGHVVLVVLMFVGRIGLLTFGSALALKDRGLRYELPEERIIVG
ncbi:TrkH family potassium uptake protein [Nonomuraea soli]|uniref:Potassium uptake TrkH family protein n=1 Tax=Nonomuraea soli TaxID=1032476 RepID=A0A7W0HQI4_9ACTN|nr:potassium transporter TrkG [Nonomuraea soli]MBA2891969.1 potassium uptake TrkH family protein [Nonomuraea soli]